MPNAARTAPRPEPHPDAPVMTADQMRRQDRCVRQLQEAVDAQARRDRAWLKAGLTVVPAKRATRRAEPEAD